MTRLDFYGVLFVHFPAVMPWDQARRELERLIREITEFVTDKGKENQIVSGSDVEETSRLRVIEAKNERAKRRAEFLKKQDDWSF